ncbi:MAG: hypothetical protein ACFFDP_06625 [Promethearchaeota archaeon]
MQVDFLLGIFLDIFQTVAIVVTIAFSLWQWLKTRQTVKINNYARIIGSMNSLRAFRLSDPSLERFLFDKRKGWKDDEISKRVYGVMLANIFEWVLFSRKADLIDKEQWEFWVKIWKEVILQNETFRDIMCDWSVYTFSDEACNTIRKWIKEAKIESEE